jgi:transposase
LSEASRIKEAYEKKAGKKVSKSTVYRMMKRHGYRKIVPYKRHKEGEAEEQGEFKKISKA